MNDLPVTEPSCSHGELDGAEAAGVPGAVLVQVVPRIRDERVLINLILYNVSLEMMCSNVWRLADELMDAMWEIAEISLVLWI